MYELPMFSKLKSSEMLRTNPSTFLSAPISVIQSRLCMQTLGQPNCKRMIKKFKLTWNSSRHSWFHPNCFNVWVICYNHDIMCLFRWHNPKSPAAARVISYWFYNTSKIFIISRLYYCFINRFVEDWSRLLSLIPF